tara:strand:+ start:355 stop:702 length:348 start_codon:yes stop_codon:yes gene_type:complete
MNLRERIKILLKEELSKEKLIKQVINVNLLNNEMFCGVEVIHPKDRTSIDNDARFERYKIKVFFLSGPKTDYWPKTELIKLKQIDIMNQIEDLIESYFGIYVDTYSVSVTHCNNK